MRALIFFINSGSWIPSCIVGSVFHHALCLAASRSASAALDGGYICKTTSTSSLGLILSTCTTSIGRPRLLASGYQPLRLLTGRWCLVAVSLGRTSGTGSNGV
jgi:hypothetical protein